MLKQILSSFSVNFPLHVPDVPDIEYFTNISTTFTSNITHPPTYEHLHRQLLPEKEGNKKLVPYKKYLMSLITIVNSNCQLVIPKLMQIFIFGLKKMSFICTMNLNLNGKQIMKNPNLVKTMFKT